MNKSILVLEGGAMRSLYTSGVLDVFMNNDIDVDCVVGVSAGALVGSNYISKQKGRTADININFCKDSNYIGIKALKKSKGLVGFDYLFGKISKEINPFDEETFFNSNKRFVIGATNCNTGKTEFFEKNEHNIYTMLQASSSMPMVSSIVKIDNKPYLDGALDCNIPLEWAAEQGYSKIILVLTRQKEYRKPPLSSKMKNLYKIYYKKYPKLIQTLYDRPNKYNKMYEKIEKLEEEGKILVLQPKNNVNISRLEKNQDKLRNLYEEGIDEAQKRIDEIKKFLQI